MSSSTAPDAVLVGGPRDGTLFTAEDSVIVELEIDGAVQRYLRTRARQDHLGRPMVVFAYEGGDRPVDPEPLL